MRVVDRNGKTLTEYDLTVGYLVHTTVIREDATPIDDVTKFAWYDEDYEEVQMYLPNPVEDDTPTQLDRIEAQVAYTAMMTDTLLEV